MTPCDLPNRQLSDRLHGITSRKWLVSDWLTVIRRSVSPMYLNDTTDPSIKRAENGKATFELKLKKKKKKKKNTCSIEKLGLSLRYVMHSVG